jgi:hypothetical protein
VEATTVQTANVILAAVDAAIAEATQTANTIVAALDAAIAETAAAKVANVNAVQKVSAAAYYEWVQ